MDTPIADPWAGGSVHTDFRAVLLGDGTGNTPFWVRNLGGDPPYGKDPGGVPPPGGERDQGATPPATSQRELALPTTGGRDGGGRDGGTGDLHRQEAEHGGPVHRDSAHSGPLSGGGEMPRGTGGEKVVGAGGVESCGRTGGRGGGRDGRGRRLRQS